MFNTLRWKLTAFNTAITGAIVVGMTLLCLFVSEKETRAQTFRHFAGNFSTMSAQLGDRMGVSWLGQLESSGHLTAFIRDGGVPLYSMELSQARATLEPEFRLARDRAAEDFGLRLGSSRQGGSCTFSLEGGDGEDYFAGVTLAPRNGSMLELVCLYPLAEMEAAIHSQRQVVWTAVLAAVALLGLFSWRFTGRMLRPIQENQARQTQFVAAASHELRTPLTVILSAASAMEKAGPDHRARFSQIIQGEGKRMSRLICDMLTLASGDSGSWEIRPEPGELDMLLLRLYETYLPLARERGLTLLLTLPQEGGRPVPMDAQRMEQVLAILLDNALSYTPAPGKVHMALTWARGRARITVSDTGPGVPREERERIFQRFHRGETARSDRAHFGLGLSIAWEIVKRHRGKLWVEDAQGGGAAFAVELPSL